MENWTVLVSGMPRVGKTSFADYIDSSDLGLTHVPLDKYFLPTPAGKTFLEWVKWPSCIDWGLLLDHLEILSSGRICFSPSQIWTDGRNSRETLSRGGSNQDSNGRKMVPKERGCLVTGCHSFSLRDTLSNIIKLYVDTPDSVLACRLENRLVLHHEIASVIKDRLGESPMVLGPYKGEADIIVDGTLPHDEQYLQFASDLASFGV